MSLGRLAHTTLSTAAVQQALPLAAASGEDSVLGPWFSVLSGSPWSVALWLVALCGQWLSLASGSQWALLPLCTSSRGCLIGAEELGLLHLPGVYLFPRE